MSQEVKEAIAVKARSVGFDQVGFLSADLDTLSAQTLKDGLEDFVSKGHHGTMGWLEDRLYHRSHPKNLWDETKSIIVLAMNYGPEEDPRSLLDERGKGNISVYARGKDYHTIVKKRLKALGRWLGEGFDCDLKVFVDTAPVPEKYLAALGGIGWQGKHTNVVSNQFGSWLFLGAIYTTLELDPDAPHRNQCGSCSACITACPTDAFPEPYKIDARRCISYLTIEHKGAIPVEFREAMGNRIYGCDDCLAACPWNKFAQTANEAAFHAREALKAPDLSDLLTLDDAEFRALFAGSPIKRIGRDRFIRNTLIAAGNSGDRSFLETAQAFAQDANEPDFVRETATWAVSKLSGTT